MAINFNPMDGSPINGALFGAAGVVVGEVMEITIQEGETTTLSAGVTVTAEPIMLTFETFAPEVGVMYTPDTIEMLLTPLPVSAEIHVEPEVPLTEITTEMLQANWGTGATLRTSIDMRTTFFEIDVEVPVNLPEAESPMDLQFLNFTPGGWFVIAFGQVSLDIEQIVDGITGRVTIYIEQAISAVDTVSLDIEQIITDPDLGQVSVQIEQIIHSAPESVSVDIQQSIWDDDSFIPSGAGETKLWTPVVMLGGTDVSARLTGAIRVEAEEGTARIAEFSTRPFSGIIDLLDWVGQSVTIDYATTDSDGVILVQIRLFTGKVDVPNYDPNTRITRFECTDDLQNEIEGLTRAGIDNLVPGTLWHEALFEEDTDNYSYLQDRLSTIDRFVDKNANGILEYTPWAAKVTPDFSFDTSNIIDQSLGIELASSRDVTNDICIEFNYRFERLRERLVYFKWDFPGAFCEFLGQDTSPALTGSYSVPRRDMVIAAAENGNWCLDTISFKRLPQSQLVSCSTGLIIWVIGQELRDSLVYGVSGAIKKRFAQSINEKWNIRLQSPQSQAVYGQQKLDKSSQLTSVYDTSEWELDNCQSNQDTTFVGSSISEAFRDTDVDADDGTARADADEVIEIEIAIAKTEILAAHRENIASFDLCLFPVLERDDTLEIDTETMDCRGKVSHFTHVMDLTRGSAVTSVQLALSRSNDDACSESEELNQPDTLSDAIAAAEDKIFIDLPTEYGGIIAPLTTGSRAIHERSIPDPSNDEDVLPEDEFTGYVGNKSPTDIGSNVYNERFVIRTQEIDEADREEQEFAADSPVVICVPNDFLELAA